MSPRPTLYALIHDVRDLGLLSIGRELGEIVVVTAVPPERPTAIGVAHGAGVERVVRVWDPVLAEVDYLAVAHVLACAVRHLSEKRPSSPVIVLATDRGRGAVGPAVAERLAVTHLGAVRHVEVRQDGLIVDRHCGGELRRFFGPPPVVLACTERPTPPERSGGTEPEQETLDLATLQITVPELQYRRRFLPTAGTAPPHRPHVVSNVEILGDRLARDGLWPLPRTPRRGEP